MCPEPLEGHFLLLIPQLFSLEFGGGTGGTIWLPSGPTMPPFSGRGGGAGSIEAAEPWSYGTSAQPGIQTSVLPPVASDAPPGGPQPMEFAVLSEIL